MSVREISKRRRGKIFREPTSITSGNSVSRRRMNVGRGHTYTHAIAVQSENDRWPSLFSPLLYILITTTTTTTTGKNEQ